MELSFPRSATLISERGKCGSRLQFQVNNLSSELLKVGHIGFKLKIKCLDREGKGNRELKDMSVTKWNAGLNKKNTNEAKGQH